MSFSEFLHDYVTPINYIFEGGASGHMKHIIDYDELTLNELKGIIYSLFGGRIEKMTEKVDGTNIQASMNNEGQVVFVRNKTDLNSERGGMSIEDMITKWSGKDKIQQTFVESGRTLEKVFKNLGVKFFNPDPSTRLFLNCECMIEGTTNIMPYISSKVNVHDIWIYKLTDSGWEHTETTKNGLDKVEAAMKDIDSAQLTPEVIVKVTEEGARIRDSYFRELNKLFRDAHLKDRNTIDDFKKYRYDEWVRENAKWMLDNSTGFNLLYKRLVYGDKSTNIRSIKELYPGHESDVDKLDKEQAKELTKYIIEPLDIIFLKLGNDIINLCQGFINDVGKTKVIDELKTELESTVADIQNDPNTRESSKTKLLNQLNRLNELDGQLNATEGIVFTYKGRLMKCTGSFSPLNQILGSLKYNK